MSQPSLPALLCISSAAISLAAPFVSVSSHPCLPSLHLVSSHPWPPSLRLVSSRPWLLPCLVAAIYGCKRAANRAAKIQINPNTTKHSLPFFIPLPFGSQVWPQKTASRPGEPLPAGWRHHCIQGFSPAFQSAAHPWLPLSVSVSSHPWLPLSVAVSSQVWLPRRHHYSSQMPLRCGAPTS